jgi:DnaJ-class molecular chaperone
MSRFNLPPGCTRTPGDDPDECETCDGLGYIDNEEYDETDPESEKNKDCPDCAGLGVKNKRAKHGDD